MKEQTFHVPSEDGFQITLSHMPAEKCGNSAAKSVLYVHGATFPAALSVGFDFDGRSWMDDLASNGFNVWALDFVGYGNSERYAAGGDDCVGQLPGRCKHAIEQIGRAVRFAMDHDATDRISIIAHSWGTMPAARFAGDHPDVIDRLVLFGPIARRDGPKDKEQLPRVRLITVKEQHDRFAGEVPDGYSPVLAKRHFDLWAEAYLASDPESARRNPPAVSVPSGPVADIRDAWSGELPYDPTRIQAPTLIVRGEWDSLCSDSDAHWLFNALTNASRKHDIKIAGATHLMHLEKGRHELHEVTRCFLAGASVWP